MHSPRGHVLNFDGAPEGSVDGIVEGHGVDGVALGDVAVGSIEGTSEGASLGDVVGSDSTGILDGVVDGFVDVGSLEGALEGKKDDGSREGRKEGEAEGVANVGGDVSDAEGDEEVGSDDGFVVVGSMVGWMNDRDTLICDGEEDGGKDESGNSRTQFW